MIEGSLHRPAESAPSHVGVPRVNIVIEIACGLLHRDIQMVMKASEVFMPQVCQLFGGSAVIFLKSSLEMRV